MNLFTPLSLLLTLIATLIAIKGYYQSAILKNSSALTKGLFTVGIFVWGDAITIAPFWILVGLIGYFTQDVYLFFTLVSLFWVVRAYGEVQYWIAEQFSAKKRNNPKNLWGNELFNNDYIYFGYQTFWQIIMVFSSAITLYFGKAWLF